MKRRSGRIRERERERSGFREDRMKVLGTRCSSQATVALPGAVSRQAYPFGRRRQRQGRGRGLHVGFQPRAAPTSHSHDHDHDHFHPGSEPTELGLDEYVDSLKWDDKGLLVAIAQDVDTGENLMQAFANREAVKATLKTKLGTFYSRSRKGLWCKGDTSGNYLHVKGVYVDCDSDSLVYLCNPVGPACHTGAPTCWFERVETVTDSEDVDTASAVVSVSRNSPFGTLGMLENVIRSRQEAMGSEKKPSWTAKLLGDCDLMCSKVTEEAGELVDTVQKSEGKERTVSEAADLIYHCFVLLRFVGVDFKDVLEELRRRFGESGIEEKEKRKVVKS